MKHILVLAALLLLTACGVQPSGVSDGGEAPTGVAPGVTLYFLDAHDQLRPDLRDTGRLGTIADALALLLDGTGGSTLRTGIGHAEVTRVLVDVTPGVIDLRVPLAAYEVTPLGIDQIVCTALGVHRQSGGSRATRVRVNLTSGGAESATLRTCPLFT